MASFRFWLVALVPLAVVLLVVSQGMAAGTQASGSTALYLPFVANQPTATPTPTNTPTATATHGPTATSTSTPLNQDTYAHGAPGYDVSFPNCAGSSSTQSGSIPSQSSLGTPYQYAIVGINDGRAFYENPCFASEFWTAASQVPQVSFYLNINAPIGPTAWEGLNGPKGQCNPSDEACQGYNYGYNAAQDAVSYATGQLGSAIIANRIYWLDVEIANSWWTTPTPVATATAANDDVLQGAIDYFHGNGLTVGIYSIASMWNEAEPFLRPEGMAGASAGPALLPEIAGSGWQPGVPGWTAGASSLTTASGFCGTASFTGGPTWLVQSYGSHPGNPFYDEDYAC
jgi:hypothetical protein